MLQVTLIFLCCFLGPLLITPKSHEARLILKLLCKSVPSLSLVICLCGNIKASRTLFFIYSGISLMSLGDFDPLMLSASWPDTSSSSCIFFLPVLQERAFIWILPFCDHFWKPLCKVANLSQPESFPLAERQNWCETIGLITIHIAQKFLICSAERNCCTGCASTFILFGEGILLDDYMTI